MPPLIYSCHKLSHTGLTTYTIFENLPRRMHQNSLKNLISNCLKNNELEGLSGTILNSRKLNEAQSRKLKKYASKLCYYSKVRKFESKKTGNYSMKVAFLTLTAPEGTTDGQLIIAFEHFLDYLRRTANCVYVWKKELGEKTNKLHFHVLINNFIPYYIVSWKWKKLLIKEGVEWPKREDGKDTDSHYRIELPRSKKLVSHYISKYLAKAYELPRKLGYISGHSELLEECKEERFIENDLPYNEIIALKKNYRTIEDQFLIHICVDLATVEKIAPIISALFKEQKKRFEELISLPQKFGIV